jgi:hypothetical protein
MFLPLHPGLNRGCPSFFISRRLVTTRDAKEPVRLLRSVATGPAQSPVALAASAESRRQSTAYGRLRLLDSQVAQQPVERLLVGVVLLPAGEVADVSEKRPEPGHGQRQRMAPPPWRSRAGPEAYVYYQETHTACLDRRTQRQRSHLGWCRSREKWQVGHRPML